MILNAACLRQRRHVAPPAARRELFENRVAGRSEVRG